MPHPDQPSRPSDLRQWSRRLLDEYRGVAPARMLDCAAHMLLYLDEPATVHNVALQYLLDTFEADRSDLGFSSPDAPGYVALAERRRDEEVRALGQTSLPNLDPGIQIVWQQAGPVALNFAHDSLVARLRPVVAETLGTRSKLARRLEQGGRAFGLVCVDYTEAERTWTDRDLRHFDSFVSMFLSPILIVCRQTSGVTAMHVTHAEREVLELAACGYSYKEIAKLLGKSPNTVDNQLRALRSKFGVRNQVELLLAWSNA